LFSSLWVFLPQGLDPNHDPRARGSVVVITRWLGPSGEYAPFPAVSACTGWPNGFRHVWPPTVQTSKMSYSVWSNICWRSNFIKYDQTRCPNGKIFAGSQSNIWSCLVAKQFPFGQESFPSYFGTRNPATSQWNVFHVFYLHVYREMIHLQIYRLGCLVMVHLTHKTSQGWSSFHSYCNLFIYPLFCIVWWSQSLKWHPYLGVQALFGPRKLIYDRKTHMYLKQI